MTRALLLAALLPLAARAGLVLSVVSGSSETPLGDSYVMGPILAGDRATVLLSLRNTESSAVQVTRFNVDQPSFQLNAPSTPFVAVPGIPSAISLSFSVAVPGTYTATLRLNDRAIVLSGTAYPASFLTIDTSCPVTPPRTINYGIVIRGQSRDCSFDVRNNAIEPLTVAFSLTGAGFTGSLPAAIAAGQSASFTVRFQPGAAQSYAGTLRIGPVSYTLLGQGAQTPLPTPILDYESRPLASAQQRRLSARLPSASPLTGSGTVRLTFIPASGLLADPAIAFLDPLSPAVPFTVQEGSTEVRLGGQPFATFQTGTTAGQIQFTMTSALFTFEGDPTATLTIAPAPAVIDSAFGTRGAGHLDVKIIGYDNTHATGQMTFVFHDTAGAALGAPIEADFRDAFRAFYTSGPGGSPFQVIIRFPVTGNIDAVGSVEATLTNPAGATPTSRLVFQ